MESRCMNCSDEELISSIVEQNVLNELSGDAKSAIGIVRKYQNKHRSNSANLIIQVNDSSIYNILKTKEKINVGWRVCYITDYYNIVRCYKCAGYNHFAKDCRNEMECFRCSSKHKTDECNKEVVKCINYIKKVERVGVKVDANHAAYDPTCLCYQRIVESIVKKTSFEHIQQPKIHKKPPKSSIISITLLYTNLCSVLAKFNELETQVISVQPTLVTLTETWLNKNIPD